VGHALLGTHGNKEGNLIAFKRVWTGDERWKCDNIGGKSNEFLSGEFWREA
jgi:hypothetical protein